MIALEHAALPWHGEAFETVPLLKLLKADGIVSRTGSVPSRHGITVEEPRLEPIVAALRKLENRGIGSSHSLALLDTTATSFATEASGALYIGLPMFAMTISSC